jgi:1-deoxy-D-xylulose-5-phosphate reductoisomerase
MSNLQNITILGSTGTIGVNTLDVIARHSGKYRAYALTANTRFEPLLEQCRRFKPRYAVMLDASAAEMLHTVLREEGLETEVLSGMEALEFVAALPEVDTVMAAIVGAAGLKPSLAAAQAGKRVLLANKETLVMSGSLFMDAVHQHGATLLPIDSEHNAIFQCLPADGGRGGVRRLLLTASGGPFRGRSRDSLSAVTPDQACAHPKWVMGRKISVDSATLMNKGLEVIEAHHLFDLPAAAIEVLVHPQSIVHSLVDYVDGSVLAQLGNPDMRTALAHGLAWPERISSGVAQLDLASLGRLDFEPPDPAAFPCLGLAYAVLATGGTAPAILNAANEVAVAAFLDGRLPFLGIPDLLEATLASLSPEPAGSLDVLMASDVQARRQATELLSRMARA